MMKQAKITINSEVIYLSVVYRITFYWILISRRAGTIVFCIRSLKVRKLLYNKWIGFQTLAVNSVSIEVKRAKIS